MRYLSATQLLFIHAVLIEETGGRHGVRDHHALLSLEGSPKQKVFGKVLYPTIYEKAAVYVRAIITEHPFIDGNKRTGIAATAVFLEDNGYSFGAGPGQVERFALTVATKRMELGDISSWLGQHAKKKSSRRGFLGKKK